MIGYLEGKIQSILFDSIIINNSGTGYRIFLGEDTIHYKKGDKVELYIHTHVRENELKLFGFKEEKMLILFEMLIGVNGVGPKVALSIVGNLGVANVVNSILQKEPKELRVKGVGIKTANKIVLDLHDRLEKEGYSLDRNSIKDRKKGYQHKEKLREVSDALVSLGYKRQDVDRMIDLASLDDRVMEMNVEQLIKHILSRGSR